MNIKLKIVKIQLESLRNVLHFLLNYKNPTDKIVIFISQQLDEVVIKYQKIKYASYKISITDNRCFLNKTLN